MKNKDKNEKKHTMKIKKKNNDMVKFGDVKGEINGRWINECYSDNEEILLKECYLDNEYEEEELFNKETKYEEDIFENLVSKSSNKKREKESKFLINFNKRKRVVVTYIANKIINENKFICINEEIYLYLENLGYYKRLSDQEIRVFVYKFISLENCKHFNSSDIESIIYFIKISDKIQKNMNDIKRHRNLVNTKSGVYDIRSKKILPHDHKYMFFSVVNAEYNIQNYNDNFYNSRFYKFLNEITLGDEELKQRLKEITGYCLCNANQMRQFYILIGDGGNGKSIFLNLLMTLVGEENTSNIQLNQLSDQKYIAELANKMVNIGSELSDIKLGDTSAIKSLVNDTDKVICRPLYKQPFSFVNYCKLIFATNNLPELNNKNYKNNTAFFNRAIIIPFNNIIPVEKQDKNLNNQLRREIDLVLVWALEGLEKVRKNKWNLSECEISTRYSLEYRDSQSYIERFLKERIRIDIENKNYMFKSDLKDELERFCIEEGIDSNISDGMKYLHNLIIKKYGIKYKKIRIGDKTRQGYIGICL
ncbi:phage/plasmid primase, P4 family domain-containing protein [Clostridium sp. 7_2_43FAA]|uniref:DNA primase family protein n=1 Tax=Clostridium TaxID=1485 RepID=UPI00019B08DA|nr:MULTISPECIES: phage/plasmid primase, P4 family [Clostridium]EEH99453.1 phage/plasmid primase, P4 family domain-containing protein [Clostridium sp. 7_2_43FAA]